MDSLTGKTIRWRFTDDPAGRTTYEHSFAADGSVTWTIVDGPHSGASARETPYGAVEVADDTLAISYRGASGHTLTVVLNLDDGRMYGFASNDQQWFALQGTFEFVQ